METIVGILLVLCLVVTQLSVTALAANGDETKVIVAGMHREKYR